MSNYALAYFLPECSEELKKNSIIKRFLSGFLVDRPKKHFEIDAQVLFEAEGFTLYTILLPLKQSNMLKMKVKTLQHFNKQLSQLIEEKNILNCFLPRVSSYIPESCVKLACYDTILYKCLFMQLLEHIYTSRGIDIGDLNIVIVKGDDNSELEAFLEVIAPFARYITVLSQEAGEVEKLAERLYEEYGLSIGVSHDFRNCFKDMNLVINFGRLEKLAFRPRFGVNTVIMNYGVLDNAYISSAVTVISGIDIELPGAAIYKNPEFLQNYSIDDIAGLLIFDRLNLNEDPASLNSSIIHSVSQEFKYCGLAIQKLKGSYNPIRFNDIKVV